MTPESGAGIVGGIGCRPACPAEAIIAAIGQAEDRSGHRVTRIAAPAFRAGHAGLLAAAATLGLPITWVAQPDLLAVQPRCGTYSARVEQATGVGSVAEGCALAAAGPGGRLLLPRLALGPATCALACGA